MQKGRALAIAAAVFLGTAGTVSAGAASYAGKTGQSLAPVHVARAAAPAGSCTYTQSAPADKFQGIPTFDPVKAARPYDVLLATSQGRIRFEALTDKAPCTTFSFRFLTEHRYFDRTHCHRLTTQRLWVLQCGDPTGQGSGGPGYSFADENLTGATYKAGTVAMANSGPGTNGSQVFIVYADSTLPASYTPFGTVVGGLDVVKAIAAKGVAGGG